MEEKFENFMEEIQHMDLSSTYHTSLIFFRVIENEQYFYTTLMNSGQLDILGQYFENAMQYLFRAVDLGYGLDDEQMRYYASYRAGGLSRLLVSWINSGMKESPEDMAEMATEFDLH